MNGKPCRRSPHGERGLKLLTLCGWQGAYCRRSPHGERGLKYRKLDSATRSQSSLPTRGAWIEIHPSERSLHDRHGRSPHGERGLKFALIVASIESVSRSPHGERGLKLRCKMHR